MDRYLRRLGMEDNTPVPNYEKTEKLLKRLERDGYVFKVKEGTGTGEDDVYWSVGPRGKVEVGELGVRGLVGAVYGEMGEGGDEELERRVARSLGLGEAAAKVTRNGEKKKRGRPREDAEEEEDEESGDEQNSGREED